MISWKDMGLGCYRAQIGLYSLSIKLTHHIHKDPRFEVYINAHKLKGQWLCTPEGLEQAKKCLIKNFRASLEAALEIIKTEEGDY